MTPSTFRSIVTRIATLLLVCGVSAPMAWAYQYKTCNGHAQTWDTDGRKFRRLRVSFPLFRLVHHGIRQIFDLFGELTESYSDHCRKAFG